MRSHSELEGWDLRDLGSKPMDFVSSDRAIYDHLTRLVNQKPHPLDLKEANPNDFFDPGRGVACVESWMSAMGDKYDPNKQEW